MLLNIQRIIKDRLEIYFKLINFLIHIKLTTALNKISDNIK